MQEAPDPSDPEGFDEFTRAMTLKWVPRLGLGICAATLLWWPLDQLLYADSPELRQGYAGFRWRVGLLIAGCVLIAPRLEIARRHAELAAGFVIAATLALTGWWLAVIGDGDATWLHYAFLAPQLSVMLLVPLVQRCLFSLLFAWLPALTWAANPRADFDGAFLLPGLSYLVFSAGIAAFLGHVVYALLRESFVLRKRTDRQRKELAELAGRLGERVADQTRSLRALHERAQHTRTEQRVEIARELHDGMGQELTSLRLLVGLGGQMHGDHEAGELFGELDDQVDRVQQVLRRVLLTLRPQEVDDLGLVEAVHVLAADLERRTGLAIPVEAVNVPEPVPHEVSAAAYRIVQEALTNTIRHARASTVRVRFTGTAAGLRVEVTDDGRGIDEGRVGMGLGTVGVRERAEALGGSAVWSGGRGTALVVELPLEETP